MALDDQRSYSVITGFFRNKPIYPERGWILIFF